MPIPLAVAAGAALLPSVYKLIAGGKQVKDAKNMKPVNPGYQMNTQVIDNARVLGDRYSNYTMPGMTQAQNQIGTNFATGLATGTQGATSAGDVLDLAARLSYGANQANNTLMTQNASGKDQALLQSLSANAQAGQQYQNKNLFDIEEYQRQLREKAALLQAGNVNQFGAANDVSRLGTSLLNPKQSI